MDSKIEIVLKRHESYLHKALSISGWVVLLFCLVFSRLYSSSFFNGWFILFLVLCVAFGLYNYLYFKHPTVITADSEKLVYKHRFSSFEILLADIKKLTCVPYFTHGRYSSEQRISLTIYTKDDELDLNDSVDTNVVLSDKLEDKETDIPLIRLYRFLMKQTGQTE